MSALKICPQCAAEYPANARFCEIDGTALRSAGGDTDMVGSIVADRYHILRKLGEGGMGQVYLAEHVKMGRKSALKVMRPGMVKDVDAISRFNREAANASRISHPNVAAIYDFGETPDGVIYLAMEFVDGVPLTKIIEPTGSLPPQRAAEIVRQTADALAVAHDMAIVHRDLKPDNIMVGRTREGADLVKVVDFGIAKAAGNESQKVTKTGLVVGTPEYMSPEQLAGDKLDGRSDIYSLALVAFNMLTGKLPFPGESAQESMIMRLTDRPKALHDMRPDVTWPAEVQAVMDRALERDAASRYQTATEFGRDLCRAVEQMPEAVAAQRGTQAVDLPPTRVAPPASEPAPAPAPMRESGAAPRGPGAAAPVRQKRLIVPILAGVTALAVAAAAIMVLTSPGKPAAAADTSSPTAERPVGVAPPTTPTPAPRTSAPPADSNPTDPPAATATATQQSEPAKDRPFGRRGRAIDRLVSFEDLYVLAKDSKTAPRALREVRFKSLSSAEDSVWFALVVFKARLSLNRDDGCPVLRKVEGIAPRTSKARLVAENLLACPD